ncbi:hypothetical protein EDB80DRAFT_168055 [Ilyonectria destructans]|nr:hypothetical protein EDB80DRAFT_168055 [Ilyonectria destructans]
MTSPRTNLGPLTTEFTYPASCTVVVQACENCGLGWQAQTCSDNSLNEQGVQDNANCWPDRTNSSVYTEVALYGWGFYSPGISCPAGYATACVATGSAKGGFPFQFSVLKHETVVGCCPTAFQCKYNPGYDPAQTCYSVATTGSFATVQCSAGKSNGFSYLELPMTYMETLSSEVATSTLRAVTIFAPLFQLNFQSTDIPTRSTPTSDTASGLSAKTVAASTSATSHADGEASTNSGLSTGVKAGIGAAAGVVFIAIIAAAVFLFLRKRRTIRTPLPEPPKDELSPEIFSPAELYDHANPHTLRPELP